MALLTETCGSCHGLAAAGGLNLSTYENLMQGGESGPVIVSGDGENSLLVTLQKEGGHPGQLSEEDIARVQEWIDAGASEE